MGIMSSLRMSKRAGSRADILGLDSPPYVMTIRSCC